LSAIRKLLFVFLVLAGIPFSVIQAQTVGEFNHSKYVSEIKSDRLAKDKEMLTDEHSPIASDEKAGFTKLNYFRPKVSFRKSAKVERFDQATHFLMKTTTDRLPEYSLYGKITFRHKGKKFSLNIYQNIELVKKPGYEKHLFIPFNDKTNGNETYGGGRFLDITETGSDTLVIDFNKGYNPYCAYNHKYSCPIPPESNSLKIKIKAGEKKWHK
jgi:uncharacterized protein (DUF1684 family)